MSGAHHDHTHHGQGHTHGHDHGHSHAHGGGGGHPHHHAPASFGTAFAVGAALNIAFVAAEAVYGVLGHSVALLADAGHNLGDVLGLFVAWGAASLGRRAPSERFTYGLRSSSILAALFNAVVLLVVTGGVAWEAVRRLASPEPTAGLTVMAVAAAGIAVNGITAWLFASGRKGDLNIRGAFQHMLADAIVSAGVVVAGAAILFTGWQWLDPLVSLVVSGVIVWGTWGLLRDSLQMVLHAVPPGIDVRAVRRCLEGQPGVFAMHHLHIWPMSTTETALTCHLVMPAGHPGDAALRALCGALHERFGIGHTTVQVETGAEGQCPPDCGPRPAHQA